MILVIGWLLCSFIASCMAYGQLNYEFGCVDYEDSRFAAVFGILGGPCAVGGLLMICWVKWNNPFLFKVPFTGVDK